jgi:hypothetical protein
LIGVKGLELRRYVYDVTSSPPVHETRNESDVTLAVKPVGFVGDVRVLVLTEAELVDPEAFVAVTTRL